jgi:hypothetical protein
LSVTLLNNYLLTYLLTPVSADANLVTSNGCIVSAINLVTADGASCQIISSSNSADRDNLSTNDGDGIEVLDAAKHGVKRRWTFEENTVFKRSFREALSMKRTPSRDEILSISNELKMRSVVQIRTRHNNILLGKQKLFC